MDIRCRKTRCKYNDKHTCKAKGITIREDDTCQRYEGVDKEVRDETKSLFERVPEFAPQRDSRAIEIICETKCILNKKGRCIANGVTINDIKEKPHCMTHIKR